MTQEQIEAIQDALADASSCSDDRDHYREVLEEAVNEAIDADHPNGADLSNVDFEEHDWQSIVKLARERAQKEWDKFFPEHACERCGHKFREDFFF
jgi:hypothetical protein